MNNPKSLRRNPLLARILEKLEYKDGDGSGVTHLKNICKENKVKVNFLNLV